MTSEIDQAKEMLAADRKERAQACMERIQAALDELGFVLVAELRLADGQSIPAQIVMMEKPE